MKARNERFSHSSFYDSEVHRSRNAPQIIFLYTFFISISFLIAVPFAIHYTGEAPIFWKNLTTILNSPSKLITDYFQVGGLGSTFFNAGICGMICNILLIIFRVRPNATTLAGYMLVVAHCFYGLNFLNMWPPFFGVLLYCIIRKKSIRENLHISLFATALAPFISELLLRYPYEYIFQEKSPLSIIAGVLLSSLFGTVTGFIVPALLPGTAAMHRGFSMYKAGLAIGILGLFAHAFLYDTFGIETPNAIAPVNPAYDALPYGYRSFMNIYFVILFATSLLMGFFLNGRSFRGYKALLKSTGYGTDFLDNFGMPVCLINIGVYGFLILGYLNIVFVLPEFLPFLPKGVGFTGATVGVTFAALTFTADGQHPRTVAPIVLGHIALFAIVCTICGLTGHEIPWSLSTQAYINGLAFATGLCPFAGKYGWKVGVFAGLLSSVLCTVTTSMHGGFVLYNGGFSAGLTALVMLPVLDFFKIRPKYEDDRELPFDEIDR